MRLTIRMKEAGATGYILFWLLGIPHSDFAPNLSATRLLIIFQERLGTVLVFAIGRRLNRCHAS
jgi:hypothetical protein